MKIITYSIIVLTFLYSCKGQTESQEKNTIEKSAIADDNTISLSQEQYRNAGIEVGIPENRTLHTTLHVNGNIDASPENLHAVSFPIGGYIKGAKLVPGMQLQKGQLMATLEDQALIQLQQDYLTAKVKLTFNKADYERQTTLSKTESNSQRVYQQAIADFESQQILVRSLAEKLRLIGINPDKLNGENISRTVGIYAPISGYITKVNVTQGKYISPTDVLFELVDLSRLHADFTVFENEAKNLRPGQLISFITAASPNQKMNAKIEYISQNVDENRTVEVHCHIQHATKNLLPGNFITGEIQIDSQRGVAIPDDGVVKWQGKYYVFLASGNRSFTLKQVTTGVSKDNFTEIIGLQPSVAVVTKNAYALLTMLKNKAED